MTAEGPRRAQRSLFRFGPALLGLGLGSCCLLGGFGEAFGRMALLLSSVTLSSAAPWSPDGACLVWAQPLSALDPSDDGARDEDVGSRPGSLLLFLLDGGAPRLLAQGAFYSPAWSPDGTAIACAEWREGAEGFEYTSLWILSPDGSERRELATVWSGNPWSRAVLAPAWSPDGEWLAFVSDRIEVVRRDASEHRWLGAGFAPAWSPDGTRIACVRPEGVHVLALDGASALRLSEELSLSVAWSPDGRQLAFDAGAEGDALEREIHVAGADGAARRRVCAGMFPQWSPEGERLLVQRGFELWTVALDGSDERRLASNALLGRWSPDGRRVAFTRGSQAWTIELASGAEQCLGPGAP